MNKWYGSIGFAEKPVETAPGVWTEPLIKRAYYGDVLQNNRALETSDQVNDDITVTSKISIVSDPYADKHFHSMRYIEFMGTAWKVKTVEPKYPRLILTLGGLWNGEQA